EGGTGDGGQARRDHGDPEGIRRASSHNWKGRDEMRSSESIGRQVRRITVARTMMLFVLSLAMAIAWNVTSPGARALAAPAAPPAMTQQELYTSVYNGWKWWHVYCYRCHGTDANGTPLAPNLTDLNRKVPLKEFLKTVRDGFPDEGMQ